MAEFFHGVRTRQLPTSLVPPANVPSTLPMAFGCAPIHRLEPEQQKEVKPGTLALLFSVAEVTAFMGIDPAQDDFEKWGLSEVAFSHLMQFGSAPVIFANLFDPAVHKKTVSNEAISFTGNEARLKNSDIIGDVTLSNNGNTAFVKDIDYAVDKVLGIITAIAGSSLATAIATSGANITANYTRAAPEMVTAADCIGGFDVASGTSTGLELVSDAFPSFRVIPTHLLAPGFSEDPSVAMIMAAKTQNICGVFNCVALADIPSDEVTLYSNVPKYKNDNNLVSENLYVCWPKIKFGDREMRMSTQVAGICANVDKANGGIPFASPSNKNLQMQAAIAGGKEVKLDLTKANYLNANGIATALNFVGGWKLWGNETACFPGVTDPKDRFLAHRRLLAWYGNQLVLTWIQKVDFAINLRQIQTIVSSEAININTLAKEQAITGGSIEFREDENNILDIMSGMTVFHVSLGLNSPNGDIEFLLEFDPAYLEALFAA